MQTEQRWIYLFKSSTKGVRVKAEQAVAEMLSNGWRSERNWRSGLVEIQVQVSARQ